MFMKKCAVRIHIIIIIKDDGERKLTKCFQIYVI